MDEEEPACRAALYDAVEERFPLIRNAVTRSAIAKFVAEHILAAEERGRQKALAEAAERIRGLGIETWEGMNEGVHWLRQGRIEAADLIDPAKPEQP